MIESVLILNHGDACYESVSYFEIMIKNAMVSKGIIVDRICLNTAQELPDLSQIPKRKYDVCLSINYPIACMKDKEGRFILDDYYERYFHIILDHPMYHHPALSARIRNYNIIALDYEHAKLIKSAYPAVNEVYVIPMAAEKSKNMLPFEKRDKGLIFTGTYTDVLTISSRLKGQKEEIKTFFYDFVNHLLEYPQKTQEETVRELIPEMPEIEIPAFLKHNFPAEVYLRGIVREELMLQILRQGIDITFYGSYWNEFKHKLNTFEPDLADHVILMDNKRYSQMPDIFGRYRLSLNILPWFKDGLHDRIPLSLINGCCCISDDNPYIRSRLLEGEEIFYYSLEDMEGAAIKIKNLLHDDDKLKYVSDKGMKYADENFTWDKWVECFITGRGGTPSQL